MPQSVVAPSVAPVGVPSVSVTVSSSSTTASLRKVIVSAPVVLPWGMVMLAGETV